MAVRSLPKLERPATHDHLAKRPRPWRVVDVCMDVEVADELAAAVAALNNAEAAASAPDAIDEHRAVLQTAKADHDAAVAAFRAKSVQMLFASIGAKRYDDLLKEHPDVLASAAAKAEENGNGHAKAEDEESSDDRVPFHIALVAASCLVPDMTVEQATQYAEDWNGQEFARLYAACFEVNGQSRMVQFGPSSLDALLRSRGR